MVIKMGWMRIAALVLLIVVPSLLLARQTFFDARDDYADQGATGPYVAIQAGTREDGSLRYKPGAPAVSVPPGGDFVWVSSVCLDHERSMIGQSLLVRLSNEQVIASNAPILLTPDSRRCGPLAGHMNVPADAPEGEYELRRIATLRPFSWIPLHATLQGVRVLIRKN